SHISSFVMESHQYLHDNAMLVHLFHKSLEGEALHWFSSLSAADLASFDIVAGKFISQFSYLTGQSPTLYDVFSEKMKPEENFLQFANRWRTIASRSGVPIPERQAVTLIVNNTTPQLKAILMLSELHTFEQLYNRAKIVQTQIKEATLPIFFESKPSGKKSVPIPTTEGVTVNEQVTAFQNPSAPQQRPPRQNYQSAPQQQQYQNYQPAPQQQQYKNYQQVLQHKQQPQQQQPRPAPPPRQYHSVPPPAGVRRPGPKRQTYPPLPETLEDIFAALMAHNIIQLPPRKEIWSPNSD